MENNRFRGLGKLSNPSYIKGSDNINAGRLRLGIPKKHIKRLDINGLSGRMLCLPKPRKSAKNILVIYDYNSSLEQIYPSADFLSKHMGVVVPDLPGVGGMESLLKLGMHTNADTLADYVASIVKLNFGRQKFVLAGAGYGFAVAQRLLDQYPAIAQRIEFVVCLGGMTNHNELNLPIGRKQLSRLLSRPASRELSAGVLQLAGRILSRQNDMAASAQMRHDMLHVRRNGKKLAKTVYYFPAWLGLPLDQTKVAANLKTSFRRVIVATDIELTVIDKQIHLKPLRTDARLPWLKGRQKSLKQMVNKDDAKDRRKLRDKGLKLPAKA